MLSHTHRSGSENQDGGAEMEAGDGHKGQDCALKILVEIVHSYKAVVDGPCSFFVEDFVEMYPDAKVVLGLRESPDAWLRSVNQSIGRMFGKPFMYWVG
ncbi:hypothetical protein M432DRAFT_627930 [Thermoascus aurantiacus ATCC 26904]